MTNTTSFRVRYAETDQMGVVYYANFFIWMEIGRTNLLRECGVSYRELEEQGIILPVTQAYAKYVSPAHYDDEVSVHTKPAEVRGPRMRIEYEIYRGEQLLCTGFTEHAFLSRETKRIIKVPDFIKAKFIQSEA
jgi:acyl-CoA thioester hydrolase